MPIRPENLARYPKSWPVISYCIRADRARWRCEWCGALHKYPHPVTGSRVILTVAHLDHQPENNKPDNLAALCQRCHNRYDAPHRRASLKRRRDQESGQKQLFGSDEQPNSQEGRP